MKPVRLLTGRPGTGKTSLIRQAVADCDGAGGFYTEEMRAGGNRVGFKLVTLDGDQAVLAHVDFSHRFRVGKYGVDVDALDRVGVSALQRAAGQCRLVVIDEIGRMEMYSESFRETVMEVIGGGPRVLGTIMLAADPWTDAIKRHPRVELVTVTRADRERVLGELRRWLESME